MVASENWGKLGAESCGGMGIAGDDQPGGAGAVDGLGAACGAERLGGAFMRGGGRLAAWGLLAGGLN